MKATHQPVTTARRSIAHLKHLLQMRTMALWALAALLLITLGDWMPSARAVGAYVWVEGESATEKTVTRNPWYETVPKAAFSGGGFLAHFDETKPGEATYSFEAPAAGEYSLWLRANPNETRIEFALNGAEWQPVSVTNAVQKFTLAGWDMRFMAWIDAGKAVLKAGRNEMKIRLDGKPKPHGILDCFVFTQVPFTPWGIEKPKAAAATRKQASADEENWFDFAAKIDPSATNTAIDLRHLNERFAGELGRIVVRDGKFQHEKGGKSVRFWAVNGPPHDLKGAELAACAKTLARYGVNLVRIHGAVADEKTGEVRLESVQHLVEVIEAMRAEGIYTHLSIYFPLWFRPAGGQDFLEGYDGGKNPFASLMFNPTFQNKYEAWWCAVMTAKMSNGKPLFSEAAVMSVELQNEDSLFFWTFSEGNLPDPQMRMFEKQFGDWLARKHGSIEKAFEAWGGGKLARDNAAEGRVAFRPLYEMFSKKTARDRDTAAFLLETQRAFYTRASKYIHSLGFEGLITCSNWNTASPEVFGPLEKYSYTIGDFIDRHGYFGCRNAGLFSEWSIRNDHTYLNRSALRFDPEEPGAARQFNHPVIDIKYDHKPSVISETTWNRPNRYRSEAPLFFAAYGALQDSDGVVHFALDGAQWSVKPGYFMQPWTLMAPTQVGQFPAAALIYREGLIAPGAVLADLQLGIEDIKNLKGTPLPQDAAFDELRLKDVPTGTELKPGNRIDPLIHFAGRTQVSFAETARPAKLVDLKPYVNRERQTVTSTTGELMLDYGKGFLTMNAPGAQGASGNLKAAGELVLKNIAVQSGLDAVHIVMVALDGKPLKTSQRMLLQVMSEEKASGFKEIPQGEIHLIENIGQDPWRIRKMEGFVRVTRPDAAQLKVTALDFNGVPVKELGSAANIKLLPDCLYYLISK